jgi:TonB family protein
MQFHIGPALGRLRLPLGPAFVSAILHVILLAVVIFGASMWSDQRPKPVYVVLAPATAAIGSPKGVTMPPPPKVEDAPAPKPAPPAELPRRDVARDLPARDLPARDLPVRDLPARDLPARDLPARDSTGLPDRKSLPLPAAPTRPRPDEKELPRVASATPAATPTPAPARPEASAAPPPPLGAATGSASGAGPLTLNVSDFPYAYYLRQVTEKIREKWNGRAIPGSQPVVVFEIRRDGRLNVAAIEKSSGNTAYDQVALRALNDAGPFPPLPDDFKKPVLRIGLQFGFDPTGG